MLDDVDELRKLCLARCKARAHAAKAAPSAALAHAEFDAALAEVEELFGACFERGAARARPRGARRAPSRARG